MVNHTDYDWLFKASRNTSLYGIQLTKALNAKVILLKIIL